MTDRPVRFVAAAALLAGCSTMVAGCSHMPQWPWHRQPASGPQVVHELVITTPQGAEAAYPQYWKGNTLIVDLRLGGSRGNAVLKPREHTVWPVRIAFRVTPGQFAVLEVRAAQRAVLPVTPAGTQPVDLELEPGVFIMKSPQIAVAWGPAAQSSGA
jgi:hypothetical protein